jgi:hypothetical protein
MIFHRTSHLSASSLLIGFLVFFCLCCSPQNKQEENIQPLGLAAGAPPMNLDTMKSQKRYWDATDSTALRHAFFVAETPLPIVTFKLDANALRDMAKYLREHQSDAKYMFFRIHMALAQKIVGPPILSDTPYFTPIIDGMLHDEPDKLHSDSLTVNSYAMEYVKDYDISIALDTFISILPAQDSILPHLRPIDLDSARAMVNAWKATQKVDLQESVFKKDSLGQFQRLQLYRFDDKDARQMVNAVLNTDEGGAMLKCAPRLYF